MSPGLNVIVPFFDRMIRVDVRERVIDVPPQSVITSDNVVVEVDAVLFSQVTDPFRATYEISNYIYAATKLAQTNLRNIIGELELDASLTSRDTINTKLREVLDMATDKWGIKVNRVEIQRIDPPHDIAEAMSRQMKAERDKRATILEAEGVRQADIEKAEGFKRAAVLEAEGEKLKRVLEAEGFAQAIREKADAEKYRQLTVADGEGQAIETVFSAIHKGRPNNELVTLRYFEVLKALADGQATKLFMPLEVSGVISSLAAMGEAVRAQSGNDHGKAEASGASAAGSQMPIA